MGIPSEGGIQETNCITEGDMYRLVVKAADQSRNSSMKEKAERFETWVFDVVLPSIRSTGVYGKNEIPLDAATLKGVVSAGCLIERAMKNQGSKPYEVAIVIDSLFKQSGIILPECFVKIPEFEQMRLPFGI